jgi:hypothetical protein
MFRYVWGMIHARDSRLYQVNCTLDHVHILTGLHPARSLADLVKEIKVSSSHWIKTNGIFQVFPVESRIRRIHPFDAGKGAADSIYQRPGRAPYEGLVCR